MQTGPTCAGYSRFLFSHYTSAEVTTLWSMASRQGQISDLYNRQGQTEAITL